MQDTKEVFSELLVRVRAGSQDAARELIDQYGAMVFRVVRNRLPADLRRAFDSEDFAQVAWNSVFRHTSRLGRFHTPAEFRAFLAVVVANKVRMEVRRYCKQKKNNVNREQPFDSGVNPCVGATPSPSQIAIARERWSLLLANQPVRNREIIKLRFLGHSTREIAAHLGLDEGSVRRILRNIRRDLVP